MYAFENLKEIIGKIVCEPFHISEQYPTAPYDIE